MFSCRQEVRRTIDLLERRLSPTERLGRWTHLLLCRHCRSHSRQVDRLRFVLEGGGSAKEQSLPRLSLEARARIAAALGDSQQFEH